MVCILALFIGIMIGLIASCYFKATTKEATNSHISAEEITPSTEAQVIPLYEEVPLMDKSKNVTITENVAYGHVMTSIDN